MKSLKLFGSRNSYFRKKTTRNIAHFQSYVNVILLILFFIDNTENNSLLFTMLVSEKLLKKLSLLIIAFFLLPYFISDVNILEETSNISLVLNDKITLHLTCTAMLMFISFALYFHT